MKVIKSFERDEYGKCIWPFKDMQQSEKVRFEGVISVWAERSVNSYKNSSGAKKIGKEFNTEWIMKGTSVEPFFILEVTRTDKVAGDEEFSL